MIHDLQPAALVGSNHNGRFNPGEDIALFERMLPGTQSARLDSARALDLPMEMSETINGSWGFRLWDRDYKSADRLVRAPSAIRRSRTPSNWRRCATCRRGPRTRT